MNKIINNKMRRILRIRNEINKKAMLFSLWKGFNGVVRFSTRSRRYAEPAMHAGINVIVRPSTSKALLIRK